MIHFAIKGFCAARFGGEDAAAKAMRDQAYQDQRRVRPWHSSGGRARKSIEDKAKSHGAPKEITIRGVTYRSQTAAAKALGVSESAIYDARRRGTLETVGIKQSRGTPIKIDGAVYPSRKAAAEALGCSKGKIWRMIDRGEAVEVGA